MISRPHQAADEADAGEADHLVQFGNEKATPANLFAERARSLGDKTDRRSEDQKKNERYRRWEIRPPELRRSAREKIVIGKAAERSEPDDQINRKRVSQRNEIGQPGITKTAPFPRQI